MDQTIFCVNYKDRSDGNKKTAAVSENGRAVCDHVHVAYLFLLHVYSPSALIYHTHTLTLHAIQVDGG